MSHSVHADTNTEKHADDTHGNNSEDGVDDAGSDSGVDGLLDTS